MRRAIAFLLLLFLPVSASAVNNGILQLPVPGMGWNAWYYNNSISQAGIEEIADYFVSSGLRDVGFEWIGVGETWAHDRVDGELTPDPTRFSDWTAMMAFIHARGLKMGLSGSRGATTCAGQPGSLGRERLDTFHMLDLGADAVGMDNCGAGATDELAEAQFSLYRDALIEYGNLNSQAPKPFSFLWWHRPAIYADWLPAVGNTFRITWDLNVGTEPEPWTDGILRAFDEAIPLSSARLSDGSPLVGPYHWLDSESLWTHAGGIEETCAPASYCLSITELRSQFSLWTMLCSAWITLGDPRVWPATTWENVRNQDLIAILRDPLGIPATRAWKNGPLEIYSRELANGKRAVAMLNRDSVARDITLQFSDVGFGSAVQVYDVWTHQNLGAFAGSYSRPGIAAHATVVLTLTPESLPAPEPDTCSCCCSSDS